MSVKRLSLAAALLLTAMPAAAQRAGGWEGTWRNAADSVRIKVARCGRGLCGTVTQASAKARADAAAGGSNQLVGTQLFRDFRMGDDGLWHGQVYVPDIGQTFDGTIDQVNRDTIVGTGCLFANFGCKSQTWRRVR
ncbi:DUF2147 domain-containing protein [Sphingomonas mucosissima]|uniref:DUF2147 domain-containing protein n=1 Tax=Sphingomonas mucosissima TaxID=370959 RepID=A0A245ZQR7_9SPHN|nr:DUF2147 domain-containing protein [Sphingomonas mucosissima]OWK32088.1 hypothetical protein SPMU_04090 [Sphingomonas mucosissima]